MTGKAVELLKEVLPIIEEQSEFETYGFPSAMSDPRDFEPDRESCSKKEIENWKKACELAEKGEYTGSHKHEWLDMGSGVVAHISKNPFGIGTYICRDPEMCSLRDRIRSLIEEDPTHA